MDANGSVQLRFLTLARRAMQWPVRHRGRRSIQCTPRTTETNSTSAVDSSGPGDGVPWSNPRHRRSTGPFAVGVPRVGLGAGRAPSVAAGQGRMFFLTCQWGPAARQIRAPVHRVVVAHIDHRAAPFRRAVHDQRSSGRLERFEPEGRGARDVAGVGRQRHAMAFRCCAISSASVGPKSRRDSHGKMTYGAGLETHLGVPQRSGITAARLGGELALVVRDPRHRREGRGAARCTGHRGPAPAHAAAGTIAAPRAVFAFGLEQSAVSVPRRRCSGRLARRSAVIGARAGVAQPAGSVEAPSPRAGPRP